MTMPGKPRSPRPICSTDETPQQIAEAVFLKIRKLPHAPASVYVRMGDVYVLSQAYKITQVWDVTYPDSFVGSLTRMERPEQIARKIARALDELETAVG
jgi:hypothetical protein